MVRDVTNGIESGPSEVVAFLESLFPICRSITGDGVRKTLGLVAAQTQVALHVTEVPSGTPVHDWVVPEEWNLRRATLVDPNGFVIADTDVSNLHLVNYSVPVHTQLSLEELQPHLHSLPDRPTLIPYRTAYWSKTWGFCISDEVRATLVPGLYNVHIDTTLEPGSLTYGELVIPGTELQSEVLVSTHVCHPSLANDNLTGIAVAAQLADRLFARPLRRQVRIVFVPGTIGSISWLAKNHEHALTKLDFGLVLTGLGDSAPFTYKRSRRTNTVIDRAAELVLRERAPGHRVIDFGPYGYDERQYCSPGYDLAVGRLGRSTHGEYPEYHTSGDNLDFVSEASISEATDVAERILRSADADRTYVSTSPFGEPQLGRRGLYRSVGGEPRPPEFEMALLWVLNSSNGRSGLLDIVQRSGLPFDVVLDAAEALRGVGLLEPADPDISHT